MLKNISNLGSVLNKAAQQSIYGGIQNNQVTCAPGFCSHLFNDLDCFPCNN